MTAVVHPTLVSQVVRHLPAPLLRALDAWSYRVARRRAELRQRRWAERQAAAAKAPEAPINYQLTPWRD